MTEAPVATSGDLLQALKVSPGGRLRTYLAPDAKVMFQSINKNACTSLKWMMADLAGEDVSGFKVDWQPFVADSEAVHDRAQWKVSPLLSDLSPEERAQIHPDNGWFIFAVVRDPRLRVFSAWQNRLLMEQPISQQYREQWWYPRHPLTRESVIEDFARFSELLENTPEHKLRQKDPHFRDQTELLVEDGVPYSRIYEISEMKQLTSDLSAHLEAQGRSGELHLPKANPTPLRAIPELFANGVKEQLERVYAADFERFGHLWDFSRVENARPWTDQDLAGCENESALGLRIAKLHELAREQRDLRKKLEKELKELKASDGTKPAKNAKGSKGSEKRSAEAPRRWWPPRP
ncbi:MAG TPA: sulfotransferase family 2 domain-containing protein [Nocardioides sp.]|nr:sulfotransferase family 2 domain-containing protein [Nocardioides sp.]